MGFAPFGIGLLMGLLTLTAYALSLIHISETTRP